jgi:predicted RNA binding protein YcfA (HicA-like mRNA interferase family)
LGGDSMPMKVREVIQILETDGWNLEDQERN